MSAKAQTTPVGTEKEPTFANQGEQEDYWAKRLFKNDYKPQSFERFKGKIIVSGSDSLRFDDTVLSIHIRDKHLVAIFTKGIFYPDIIANYGQRHAGITIRVHPSNLRKDKSSHIRKDFFEKFESYNISDFEEVKFLSNSAKVKRFRFWLFNKAVANPEVCFLELTNNTATENTSITDFINGSKLTFFAHGWIVI